MMDAFEINKFNESSFTKFFLSNSSIVSYGFISGIDFDTVTVTLVVSDRVSPEKVTCVFMNLGNEQFALKLKPEINMRVLVLSPNKAAEGMYDSLVQMRSKQGKDFISTGSPAVFSAQFCVCIPILKTNVSSISSLIIDDLSLSVEIKHDMIASLEKSVALDLWDDTSIELHEGTDHFRGCYGNMEQTFGVVQGAEGAEKPGNYIFKETFGKFSSVEKNYESGLDIIVGKAYEKPFLDNKGALTDSSAPVTINLGANAPVTLTASAAITLNMAAGIPVTLTFGDSAVEIKADSTGGLDISLTGSAPVKIVAETGKIKVANSSTTLKLVLDKIADLCAGISVTGVGVAPGAPLIVNITPTVAAQFTSELKTLISGLLE
jgi:hypothetical protein